MNKILLAGVLMFAGGFLLADAAQLDLMAAASSSFSGSERQAARASVTPFPGTTVEACKTAMRGAELEYKNTLRAAKQKRDLAVHAKNLCLKNISDARKSPKPSVSPRVVR